MKISLYTAMRNCIRQDYPFVEMVRHHLPLVDEVIINEGYSTDGTYEALRDLDPRVQVFRMRWEKPKGENWWIHFKEAARQRCTGDWCIHLDSDEFIPEWEFADLRNHLEHTSDRLIPVEFTNFYANYRIYHRAPAKVNWVTKKMIIHRNIPELEFWGDGSNLREKGQPFHWNTSSKLYTVHHFGAVKWPGRLREVAWIAGRARTDRSTWWKPPGFVFDWFPHDWKDPYFFPELAIYDGPYIQAVRDNPGRFTRDGMKLCEAVAAREREEHVPAHC